MKQIIISLILLLGAGIVCSAQGFDITGTYRGETEGMAVRIDVQEYQGDQLQFSFIAREEESPLYEADYSESGEYLLEEDGDRIRIAFDGDICRLDNGRRTFPLEKISGDMFSIPGYYTFQVEDGVELVLIVEEAGFEDGSIEQGTLRYTFIFEAWETENVLFAPMQTDTVFQLTSDWGETVILEFTPEQCLFSGESEGNIVLTKQFSSP